MTPGMSRVWVVCILAVGCSPGPAAPTQDEPKTLWASGGFACLEQDHWFDCRLLDYFIADHGQAAVPNERLDDISFSEEDTCIVTTEGAGSCFGRNANHNDEIPAGTWTMVSQGAGQTCGLHPDGSVECWGNGSEGAVVPPGPFIEVRSLDAGACARDAQGTITCWGYDYQGNVKSPSGSWAAFIFPNSYLCMLDTAGKITCTGLDVVAGASIPAGEGYHSLTGGGYFACALNADDRPMCWGDNSYGSLNAPDAQFEQIAAGNYFACGLREDGTVSCWGCREESASNPEQYCDWDNPAPWWVP